MKGRKVMGTRHHTIVKGKSLLTNLIEFCDEMTGLADEGWAADVVYLNFSRAFDTIISIKILIEKLIKYKLGKWSVSWAEN